MRSIIIIFMLIGFSAHAEELVPAPWVGNTLEDKPCKGNQGYGPFDYSKRHMYPKELKIVEDVHFTPDIENLLEGKHAASFGSPWADLDYTLRAWPNHARALLTAIRFQLKTNKRLTKYRMLIPPECYLNRAINYSPTDPVPYTLFGYYLHKTGHLDKADIFYKNALQLDPDNAKVAYSYSLLLTDMKRYDEALTFAQIAYKHPNTPPTLKKKLIKLGVWK